MLSYFVCHTTTTERFCHYLLPRLIFRHASCHGEPPLRQAATLRRHYFADACADAIFMPILMISPRFRHAAFFLRA